MCDYLLTGIFNCRHVVFFCVPLQPHSDLVEKGFEVYIQLHRFPITTLMMTVARGLQATMAIKHLDNFGAAGTVQCFFLSLVTVPPRKHKVVENLIQERIKKKVLYILIEVIGVIMI